MLFAKRKNDQDRLLEITFSASVRTALDFAYAIRHDALPEHLRDEPIWRDAECMKRPIVSIRAKYSGRHEEMGRDRYWERTLIITFENADDKPLALYLRRLDEPDARWKVMSARFIRSLYPYCETYSYLVIEPHERNGRPEISHEYSSSYYY